MRTITDQGGSFLPPLNGPENDRGVRFIEIEGAQELNLPMNLGESLPYHIQPFGIDIEPTKLRKHVHLVWHACWSLSWFARTAATRSIWRGSEQHVHNSFWCRLCLGAFARHPGNEWSQLGRCDAKDAAQFGHWFGMFIHSQVYSGIVFIAEYHQGSRLPTTLVTSHCLSGLKGLHQPFFQWLGWISSECFCHRLDHRGTRQHIALNRVI
jgi:hypothetical protein